MAEKNNKRKPAKEGRKPEKVMIKNYMFNLLRPSNAGEATPIDKLKLQYAGVEMFKIVKFIKTITESVECKAYMEQREQIVKAFTDAQRELPNEKRLPPMLNNIPELKELMDADSGLEIEKYQLKLSLMPTWKDCPDRMFNGHDMDALSWFFEYVE